MSKAIKSQCSLLGTRLTGWRRTEWPLCRCNKTENYVRHSSHSGIGRCDSTPRWTECKNFSSRYSLPNVVIPLDSEYFRGPSIILSNYQLTEAVWFLLILPIDYDRHSSKTNVFGARHKSETRLVEPKNSRQGYSRECLDAKSRRLRPWSRP